MSVDVLDDSDVVARPVGIALEIDSDAAVHPVDIAPEIDSDVAVSPVDVALARDRFPCRCPCCGHCPRER